MRAISEKLVIQNKTFLGNGLFGYTGIAGAQIVGHLKNQRLPYKQLRKLKLIDKLQEAMEKERRFLPERFRERYGRLKSLKARYQFIVRHRLGQIGLRNLKFDAKGNAVSCDVCIVPHPLYATLNTQELEVLSEAGANIGSCVVLFTMEADGTLMLVLQGRAEYNPTLKRGNATYGGNVGASAAGLVPGDKIKRVRRRRAIDVELAAQRNVLDEWREELGSDAEEVFCVGMALDLRALHHELTYLSISKHSFETLERLARISKFQDTPKAFRENFFGVPATPENFEKLLHLGVPIPATHWANFVAAYEYVLRKLGTTETSTQTILAEFVRKIAIQQARVDALCGGKYNPNLRADAQGLVSVQKALEEVYVGQLRSVIVVKD